MSHTSKVFNSVPIKVMDRSGFDLSHENLFTAKVGYLIPASVEEVMPGDVVNVGAAMSVELPPLATNFKGRVDAKLEAFFVPNRILWGGWQDFITNDANNPGPIPNYTRPTEIPKILLDQTWTAPGYLADYMGIKGVKSGENVSGEYNVLPFAAYWKIWDDWYRDSLIQNPFFPTDGVGYTTSSVFNACNMRGSRFSGLIKSSVGTTGSSLTSTNYNSCGFNGKKIMQLAARNFAKDYFTTMTAQPQAGASSELEFNVDLQSEKGSFTIASLRAANSLQKWLEKNNIAGTRYYDQILAHYGVLPPDANVDRAVLLGAMTTPVIVNSIAANSQGGTTSASTINFSKNPYAQSVGAQFGHGSTFGKDRLINKFEVKEHGYIIILFSLVPHAYYSTGTRRYLTQRTHSSDWAFPEFANIGDQAVKKSELYSAVFGSTGDTTIGYNQRYSEYKYHDDEVHGLLTDGAPLHSFVLQRGFDSGASVGSDLITIPQNYMDDVMVATDGVSGFQCVVDAYFDAKYLRVLPEYSLPSLCQGDY